MRILYRLTACIVCILLVLTLIPCLLYYGAVDFSTFTEEVTLTRTSPLLLLGTVVLILCLFLFSHALYAGAKTKDARKRRFALSLILLSAAEAALCIGWQTHYDNAPLADQKQVWNAACAIAEGEALSNASYFVLLPRQKAMALCFAVVAELFGTDYDTSIRPLNAVFLLLLLLWNALLAFRITRKEEAGSLCALLTVLFSPLVFYTCFVYGTIPSLALTAGCFYSAVRLAQTGKARYLLPESVCAVSMILVYSAAWIGATAVFLTLLVCGISGLRIDKKRAAACLAGAVLVLVLPYAALQLVDPIFSALTGIQSTETAAPTLTWIVMGLSSSQNTVAGPGSYNKLPETVMQEGETTAQAGARLFSTLKTILSEYASGTRSLSFFVEKTLYQWTDPWFGSLTLTLVQKGGAGMHGHHGHSSGTSATSVSLSFLEGLEPFLVVFRTAVLVLALLFVLKVLFRKGKKPLTADDFCRLLPALYFAGIFCFQLFWESKSRYCMPAYVGLLPPAAGFLAERKEPLRKTQKAPASE